MLVCQGGADRLLGTRAQENGTFGKTEIKETQVMTLRAAFLYMYAAALALIQCLKRQ